LIKNSKNAVNVHRELIHGENQQRIVFWMDLWERNEKFIF